MYSSESLNYAVEYSNCDMVQLLIENGAELENRNEVSEL
mgnify:CR=1 FL=1